MTTNDSSQKHGWVWSPSGLVLLAFLAIAAFFLITEHWAHVLGVLPYLCSFYAYCIAPAWLARYGHADHAMHQHRPPQGGA